MPKTTHSYSIHCLVAGCLFFLGTTATAQPVQTTTIITLVAPAPSELGYGIVVEAIVLPGGEGVASPSGIVTVSTAAAQCSFSLPAQSCVVEPGSVGEVAITASYAGDDFFAASQSAPVPHTVQVASPLSLVSRNSQNGSGVDRIGVGRGASVSGDRWVLFESASSAIVPNDTNDAIDVFLFDRLLNTYERISVGADGTETDDDSRVGGMSADGRFISFLSRAGNLVENDVNDREDVYLKDRETGDTALISVGLDGMAASARSSRLSSDGRFVLFETLADGIVPGDANGLIDGYLFDRETFAAELVTVGTGGTVGNGHALAADLSDDGRWILMSTEASNFSANDLNESFDVYLRDRMADVTELLSVNGTGMAANAASFAAELSADTSLVVFSSEATDLVSGDANGVRDVYLFNRDTGAFSLVSIGTDGEQPNAPSFSGSITDDGQSVFFLTRATNLTTALDGEDAELRAYRRDLLSSETELMAFAEQDGSPVSDICHAAFSDDGRTAAVVQDRSYFDCELPLSHFNVNVVSVTTSSTLWSGPQRPLPDQSNGESFVAAVSNAGRFVLFAADADNLFEADANATFDAFVRDRVEGVTERVSTNGNGDLANGVSVGKDLSDDGRFAAFTSNASTLVSGTVNFLQHVYVFDRDTGTVELISRANDDSIPLLGDSADPSLSDDGNVVAFISDADLIPETRGTGLANGDLFIRDRAAGTIERITDAVSHPKISSDGRFVAYEKQAAMRYDRQLEETISVSLDLSGSAAAATHPDISADGSIVVFASDSDALVADDANGFRDVFVWDEITGKVERISQGIAGEANGSSDRPSISADGRYVAFESGASNLVDADQNGERDIFVYDRAQGVTARLSIARDGAEANGASRMPVISGDGTKIAFHSDADNLLLNDLNQSRDVFIANNPLSDLLFKQGFE